MSNALPARPANFLGTSTPCSSDDNGCSFRADGTCAFCGWAACACGNPVCEPGDECATCAAPMTEVEALGWAVTGALGGVEVDEDEDEEEMTAETVLEATLTDEQLLALLALREAA